VWNKLKGNKCAEEEEERNQLLQQRPFLITSISYQMLTVGIKIPQKCHMIYVPDYQSDGWISFKMADVTVMACHCFT
jgi:hypothetical protein